MSATGAVLRLADAPPRSTLSACLIVRNEAQRLARCLASLSGLADEIIVVDTGSTDDTMAIAGRLGARVVSAPWTEDFSAARNVALELASGDWVLSIDADEWLSESSFGPVRDALEAAAAVAYRVTLVNHLDDGRREPERLTRLFRRRPDIRFRGRIHEQVTEDVARVVAVEGGSWRDLAGLTIEHDGYLSTVARERSKRDRNIALLERAVAESPDDDYLRYKLASELGSAGSVHLEQVTRRLVQRDRAGLVRAPWAEAALINAALLFSSSSLVGLAAHAAEVCAAAFGDHPALFLARAKALLASQEPAQALLVIAQAEGQPPRGPGFDADGLALELELASADAHRQLGDYDAALSTLALARQSHPGSAKPVYALIELALALGDVNSALRLGLGRLREHPTDATALKLCAQIAEKSGDLATAQRWRAAGSQGA